MLQIAQIERRRCRRYVVTGQAKFRTVTEEATGDLVNIGSSGILIRSNVIPPKGTNLSIRLTVQGYQEAVEVGGRVVGSQLDVLAVMFLEEPASVERLLVWLDKENYPWT